MRVNNSRNNIYNVKNQSQPSFKRGKTYLITDFDGTLKPTVFFETKDLIPCFKYFNSIRTLQSSLENKLKIIISTGRPKKFCNEIEEEMDYVENNIKHAWQKYLKSSNIPTLEYNFKKKLYPNVSSIITDNGEKKYKIVEDGIDYHLEYSQNYGKKKKNFLQEHYQIDLHELGNAIKQKISKFSVLAKKIKYNKHFPDTLAFKLDKNISPNMNECIMDLVKKELTKQNISFNFASSTIENTKLVRLNRNGQKFAKDLYPLMKIEKAKRNNDLIIVAGNDINDIEMLNIFSYINLPQNVKIPSNREEAQLLLYNYPEKIDEIFNLPLRLIVVGNLIQKSNKNNRSLMEFFAENFPEQYKFVPETTSHEDNNYLKAIQSSIISYARENIEFANAFNDNERNALFKDLN